MIVEIKMYGCQCDNCGASWEDDFNGYIYFTDPESAQNNVSYGEGWYTDREEKPYKHYCPKCWSMDDDLVIAPKK